MRVQGKVERRDLEGGIFQLVTDSGQRYTLVGDGSALKKAVGARVEVDGTVDEGGGFGFAMAGAMLKVNGIKAL
jgi:hypothetical protein